MKRKVNLLIIGTQKAGTTSLYEYIKQHPDIYFSDVKEVTYFVDDALYSKGEDYYHSFFTKVENEKIVASAYVHMLPCKKCPERVMEYNPEMKFIVMLREPVSRAYSAYNYAIKNGWEDKSNSFMETVALEPGRVDSEQYDLMYFENGLYHKHVSHWQQYFPRENFLILKDTDLKSSSKNVLQTVFQFLEIDQQQEIDTTKEFNKAGVVRFKWLQKFLLSKESFAKKLIGKLLPTKFKVWVRSRVLKRLYEFNQVNKPSKQITDYEMRELKNLFSKDLQRLKENYGVDFN